MIKLFLATFISVGMLAFAQPAFAQQDVCELGGQGSAFCEAQNDQVGDDNFLTGGNGLLQRVVNILTVVATVISVFGIIIGGLLYVTSNGDTSQVNRGRSAVIYSLVGLTVAIFARIIVLFILQAVSSDTPDTP